MLLPASEVVPCTMRVLCDEKDKMQASSEREEEL